MFNVLVVCTHNSARSILAEVLLNYYGSPLLVAQSAGSAPRTNQAPNPLGLQVLREHGHDTQALRSKSWDAFGTKGATPIDLVITVCDSAAGEVCPLFIGAALKVHWGYADPSAGTGSDEQKLEAFRNTYTALARRIQAFLTLAMGARHAADLQAAALAVKGVE
jgi:arsenate reductase (thioredoxin)